MCLGSYTTTAPPTTTALVIRSTTFYFDRLLDNLTRAEVGDSLRQALPLIDVNASAALLSVDRAAHSVTISGKESEINKVVAAVNDGRLFLSLPLNTSNGNATTAGSYRAWPGDRVFH